MGAGVATIVVEQRLIVRAALASLLETLKYRVVCSVANAKNVTRASIAGEECKLAILGALSADDGANEAVHVRKLWPDCKILLLLDAASCSDLQRLVASEIDGCIPLDASADTLSKALELIMVQKLRVMVAGGSKLRLMPDAQQDASQRLLSVIKDEALSIVIADIPKIAAKENGTTLTNWRDADESVNGGSPLRARKLSEREVQILESLVKGHANKVIARTCAISEATVKVHMKSILRKIRVANRTQAAVWALEHGYCCDEPEIRP
jgi:two-component system nitrate/nitrite response regulator NarL